MNKKLLKSTALLALAGATLASAAPAGAVTRDFSKKTKEVTRMLNQLEHKSSYRVNGHSETKLNRIKNLLSLGNYLTNKDEYSEKEYQPAVEKLRETLAAYDNYIGSRPEQNVQSKIASLTHEQCTVIIEKLKEAISLFAYEVFLVQDVNSDLIPMSLYMNSKLDGTDYQYSALEKGFYNDFLTLTDSNNKYSNYLWYEHVENTERANRYHHILTNIEKNRKIIDELITEGERKGGEDKIKAEELKYARDIVLNLGKKEPKIRYYYSDRDKPVSHLILSEDLPNIRVARQKAQDLIALIQEYKGVEVTMPSFYEEAPKPEEPTPEQKEKYEARIKEAAEKWTQKRIDWKKLRIDKLKSDKLPSYSSISGVTALSGISGERNAFLGISGETPVYYASDIIDTESTNGTWRGWIEVTDNVRTTTPVSGSLYNAYNPATLPGMMGESAPVSAVEEVIYVSEPVEVTYGSGFVEFDVDSASSESGEVSQTETVEETTATPEVKTIEETIEVEEAPANDSTYGPRPEMNRMTEEQEQALDAEKAARQEALQYDVQVANEAIATFNEINNQLTAYYNQADFSAEVSATLEEARASYRVLDNFLADPENFVAQGVETVSVVADRLTTRASKMADLKAAYDQRAIERAHEAISNFNVTNNYVKSPTGAYYNNEDFDYDRYDELYATGRRMTNELDNLLGNGAVTFGDIYYTILGLEDVTNMLTALAQA